MKEAELEAMKRRATHGLTIADINVLFEEVDRSRLESDRLRAAEHAQMLRGMHLADALHTLCVGLTVTRHPLQHIARSALVLYGDSHPTSAEPVREQAKPKPTAAEIDALQRLVNDLDERFMSYAGGDRPMSPPAELQRELFAAETALSNARREASVP